MRRALLYLGGSVQSCRTHALRRSDGDGARRSKAVKDAGDREMDVVLGFEQEQVHA
jgi:hypothetical protein